MYLIAMVNIPVHDMINSLYYEHWTDRQKYFYVYNLDIFKISQQIWLRSGCWNHKSKNVVKKDNFDPPNYNQFSQLFQLLKWNQKKNLLRVHTRALLTSLNWGRVSSPIFENTCSVKVSHDLPFISISFKKLWFEHVFNCIHFKQVDTSQIQNYQKF